MGRRRLLIVAAAALIVTGLVAASARYVTSVPGEAHSGPLPALTDAEAATASRLGAHIHAIASRPRNIEHHADLEKAAS